MISPVATRIRIKLCTQISAGSWSLFVGPAPVTCGECPRQREWRNSEPFSDYEDEFDEGSDVDEGDGGDDDGMGGGDDDDDGLAALMESVMEAEGVEGANNSGLSSEAEPVVPLQHIGTKSTVAPQNHGGVVLPLLVRRRLSFKQPAPNV